MDVTVNVSGPFFDGRLGRETAVFIEEAKEQVASQALADGQLVLDRMIKHPTPYYETQVRMERQADDRVVSDAGVIYGPWLEGTSGRNATTRFKGYSAFRKAVQSVEPRVPQLVAAVLAKYLSRVA